MAFPPSIIYSPGTGDTLTAAQYVAEHQSRINENIPEDIDDFSASVAEMQTQTDPGEVSSESLATSLSEEIARIRYAIQEAKAAFDDGISYWYETPTAFTFTRTTDADALTVHADVASFTNSVLQLQTDEETGTGFYFIKCNEDWDTTQDEVFAVRGDGAVIINGTNNLSNLAVAKSADYTVTDTDMAVHILVTTGGTDRTITLPTVADNTDRIIFIKKVDSGTGKITVDGEGSETIDDQTTLDIFDQYGFVELISDGSEWHIKSRSESVTVSSLDNLGMALSGGTLTVSQKNASALSASNYATVPMASDATPGSKVDIKITSNFTINDDNNASSAFTNTGFGITEANNWAEDVLFGVYLVNRNDTDADGSDGNSVLAVARNLNLVQSPSTANNIGDTAAAPVTDDENSMIIMASVTQGNYTSLPCKLIGTFRMQWASGTSDWAIQTINDADGFGAEQIEKAFGVGYVMPLAQNGANASSHYASSGTPPTWASATKYVYYHKKGGDIHVIHTTSGGGNLTAGSGANSMSLSVPVPCSSSYGSDVLMKPVGAYIASSAASTSGTMSVDCVAGDATLAMRQINAGTSALDCNDFSGNGDDIYADFIYHAFDATP